MLLFTFVLLQKLVILLKSIRKLMFFAGYQLQFCSCLEFRVLDRLCCHWNNEEYRWSRERFSITNIFIGR